MSTSVRAIVVGGLVLGVALTARAETTSASKTPASVSDPSNVVVYVEAEETGSPVTIGGWTVPTIVRRTKAIQVSRSAIGRTTPPPPVHFEMQGNVPVFTQDEDGWVTAITERGEVVEVSKQEIRARYPGLHLPPFHTKRAPSPKTDDGIIGG